MKIRELLRWFNDALRPSHVQGEGYEPEVDKTTALTTMHVVNPSGSLGVEAVPPGYVPSQQDEKPH